MSTFLADQIDAASREAHSVIIRTAASRTDIAAVRDDRPGPFAQQMLDDLAARGRTRRQQKCAHLRRGPGVAWLLAWSPERLRCQSCAQSAMLQASRSAEDDVCDVCRHIASPLHAIVGAAGPVLLAFGACGSCYRREQAI